MKKEIDEVRNARCPITHRICSECLLVTIMNDNNKKQRKPRCGITGKDIEPKSGCPKLNPEMFEQAEEEASGSADQNLLCPVINQECEFCTRGSSAHLSGRGTGFKICEKTEKKVQSNSKCPLKQEEVVEVETISAKEKFHQEYHVKHAEKLKAKVEEQKNEMAKLAKKNSKLNEANLNLTASNKSLRQEAEEIEAQRIASRDKVRELEAKLAQTPVVIQESDSELADAHKRVIQLEEALREQKEYTGKILAEVKELDETNNCLRLDLKDVLEKVPGFLEPMNVERTEKNDRVDKVIDVLHALLA